MAGAANKKISASSARAHTRIPKRCSSYLPSGMLRKAFLAFFIGFMGWAYNAIQPPPPKLCGSRGGPAITAPRIKLSDGRHLAYKEHGVPKDIAKFKLIYVHGIDTCRHQAYAATRLSREAFESLGLYIVSYDRPGYGESDFNPKRTIKSMAFDIEELADKLGLGHKFYVIGYSMGGQTIWSCLNYIPHRLAGVALLAPAVNFWWPGLPSSVSRPAFKQQFVQDQLTYVVAHYFPWLTYWWNTQKWFPSSKVTARDPVLLSPLDLEILKMPINKDLMATPAQVRQQGDYGSIYQDLNIGVGSWEFDPIDIKNPFPNKEGSVHLWQGDEDRLVPVSPQRYIAQRLPWIQYHELVYIAWDKNSEIKKRQLRSRERAPRLVSLPKVILQAHKHTQIKQNISAIIRLQRHSFNF